MGACFFAISAVLHSTYKGHMPLFRRQGLAVQEAILLNGVTGTAAYRFGPISPSSIIIEVK